MPGSPNVTIFCEKDVSEMVLHFILILHIIQSPPFTEYTLVYIPSEGEERTIRENDR